MSPRLSLLLLASLLAVSTPVSAQVRIAPVEPFVSSPGAERPVRLQAATIAIERAGGLAHTTIELTLHNPSDRPLEGQIAFPLRDGQQVSGFALDIDGSLHDAVPVPKARGREVFEAIERRQVDPALLERTEGNYFRLRVFPVPARGERRVRIELVEALVTDGDLQRLRVPLTFASGLERVPLRIAGAAPARADAMGAVTFARDGADAVAELGPRQLKAAEGLDLRWARDASGVATTQEFDGEVWFHAVRPITVAAPTPRALPRRVGLLWDASGSARRRDRDLEIALLDRYFAAAGDVEVRLHVLRDRATAARRFPVRGGDWTALKQALRGEPLDGASDLGAWTPDAAVGEYLLVSDGLANYGDGDFPTLGANQRLFAIAGGIDADTARLRALAEERGGWLVELAGPERLAAAADDLLRERARIVGIDAIGATDVVVASPFPENGRLQVGGRLTAARAEITLHVVSPGGARQQLPIVVVPGEPKRGRFLAQVVAGWRLRQLQDDPAGHRTTIRRLGERFGLVTAETSLIVLESLDDHLTYDIPPPAPWRAAFDARRSALQSDRDVQRRNNLDAVAAAFAERQAWWDTDFRGRRYAPDDEAKIVVTGAAPEPEPVPAPSAPVVAPESVMPPPPPPAMVAAEAEAARRESASAARMRRAEVEEANQDAMEVRAYRDGGDADLAAEDAPATATIALQPWAPDSDVARRLRAAPAADIYRLYLDERSANADSPAFYLDVADILLEKGRRDEALRVLSNLAELQLENRALLRVLGYRLLQAGEATQAAAVLARVRTLADEEPQSHRDLGLALDAAGQSQAAADALYEVVARPWDSRFGGIALIALAELNAIVARGKGRIDTSAYDPRLLRNLPMDLRAVLTWDADATDMDLWVTQPDGQQVSYNDQNSVAGGRLSEDFTGGYGPEEYAIRRGRDGTYRIEVDYFGSSSQLVTGAVTVQVWLSTGFGTPAQRDQRLIVRLQEESDRLLVGEFTVE